jgi:GNAT superfamily N-acetyltransferase
LDRAIYDLMMRVRPDVPVLADEPVPTFEAWSADTIEDPGFMPELTVIAIGGGRVVGAVELFDNTGGAIYIGMTAVDPDFRRRGLARLLKVELSRRAKAAGVVRIETYNDGANTGIRTLNESLGYVYLPWRLMLRGPVPVQALEQADSRAG